MCHVPSLCNDFTSPNLLRCKDSTLLYWIRIKVINTKIEIVSYILLKLKMQEQTGSTVDRTELVSDSFSQGSPYPFWSPAVTKKNKKLSKTDGQRANLSSLLPKPMEWNSMSFRIVTVCSSLAVAPTSATRSWEILAPFDSSHFRKACTDLGIKRIFCEFLSYFRISYIQVVLRLAKE